MFRLPIHRNFFYICPSKTISDVVVFSTDILSSFFSFFKSPISSMKLDEYFKR